MSTAPSLAYTALKDLLADLTPETLEQLQQNLEEFKAGDKRYRRNIIDLITKQLNDDEPSQNPAVHKSVCFVVSATTYLYSYP